MGGFYINLDSDSRLKDLRSGRHGARDNEYRIPRGGLFEVVSCPNYLGEILEWIGFAIAAVNPAAIFFAIFTMAFLLPRGYHNHK